MTTETDHVLDELFPLTPDEERRIDAAPFRSPRDPDAWKAFAEWPDVQDALLESYTSGALKFPRMMRLMRGFALGCRTADRITVQGLLAERALRIPPSALGTERVTPYPKPLQRLAAGLVQYLREEQPDKKLATILDESIAWLIAVGLFVDAEPISPRTLQDWYLEQKRLAGQQVPRGRPPTSV